MKSLTLKLIVLTGIVFYSLTAIKAVNIAKSPQSMTPPGNALAFDGVNDVVNVGNDAKLQLTQGTIEAWIKTPNAGDSWRGIVVKHRAFGLFLYNNELIAYSWVTNSNIPTGVYLNDNKWHHVALSFQSGVTDGTSIYVDGVKKLTFTFSVSYQGVSYGIGNGSTNDNIQHFNGQIDEVRIWNVARSESDIQTAMYDEITGTETGLVAYYNFNQGIAGGNNSSITTVTDRTSSGLNGALNNFAKTGSTSNFVESYAMVVPIPAAATNNGETSFTANWTVPAIGTVNSYKLDVSTNQNFSSYVSGYEGLDCGTNLSQNVTGLLSNTTYYYRVRADKTSVSGSGGYARNQISIKTLSIPKLSTNFFIKLSSTSIRTGGEINSDGNSTILEQGICWSTSPTPTINDNKQISANGTNSFQNILTNLNENSIYYIRAYATNSIGTGYGNEIMFSSKVSVYTGVIYNIYMGSANSIPIFDYDEGMNYQGSGICWSTTPNPTTSNNTSDNTLTGIVLGNTYYVRAYIRLNGTTYYGNEQCFKYAPLKYLASESQEPEYDGIYTEMGEYNYSPWFANDNNYMVSKQEYEWAFGINFYGSGELEFAIGNNIESGNPPLNGWSMNTIFTRQYSNI